MQQVLPTEDGRAVLADARIALRRREGLLMRDLSATEQDQLRGLLARVALGAGDVESCLTPDLP